MSGSLGQRLRSALNAREKNGHLRRLGSLEGIDFCSNDYLGLARFTAHDTKPQASHNGGSGGSRLISGNHVLTEALEQSIADFHGFEHSLLFSSGYAANTGLIASLGRRGDRIFLDSLAHASLIDGARLSFAKRSRFAHNDIDDLSRQLEQFAQVRTSTQQAFVLVESVYSMDGDTAPLIELAAVCTQYDAALIVDEAHAIGIYGNQGAGLVAHLNLQASVFATVYTFGKAPGRHGAVIAGSTILRDYLINFCRPFIYTTAPSPQTVSALDAAYQRMREADEVRAKLNNNIAYFAAHVKSLALRGASWLNSHSPIQGVVIGDALRAKQLEMHLRNEGFALKAILSPTVKEGSERIRICLHSTNTHAEIDRLAHSLGTHLGLQSGSQ